MTTALHNLKWTKTAMYRRHGRVVVIIPGEQEGQH
jgi:hypothetical protein